MRLNLGNEITLALLRDAANAYGNVLKLSLREALDGAAARDPAHKVRPTLRPACPPALELYALLYRTPASVTPTRHAPRRVFSSTYIPWTVGSPNLPVQNGRRRHKGQISR